MVDIIHSVDGATGTASGAAINIEDAKKVIMEYKRADHSSGKTVFSATVSPDGTNYITYNKWITNATNTNAQDVTRVASVDTGAANASGILTMSSEDGFKYIIPTATLTTDGTNDIWMHIQY